MPPALERHLPQVEQLRGFSEQDRTVDIIASTFDIDSYGTRIDQSGWDLEQFKRNPVIPLQHDSFGYSASMGLPVAAAVPESIRVEGQKLLMKIRFLPEGQDEVADKVFNMVRQGFLRGVSVGFLPTDWKDQEELVDGEKRVVRVFTKQRLLEVSIVTIPSNDNALIQLRSGRLNADAGAIRRLAEDLEETLQKRRQEDGPKYRYSEEYIDKCVAYFERKQKPNRESTKVLKRFFEVRGEKQPSDEAAAWQRMAELLEEPAPLTEEEKAEIKEEVTAGEKPAEATATETPAAPAEEKAAEPAAEETPPAETPAPAPAPTPPSTPAPAEEAPPPARTASVQLTLRSLLLLRSGIKEACLAEAAKASRRGAPIGKLDAVIDDAGRNYLASILTTHP
jgi:HK97 family phage prohead protease